MDSIDNVQQVMYPIKGLAAELGKLDIVSLSVDYAIGNAASSINTLTGILSATMNAVRDVAISTAYLAQVVGMQMTEGYNNANASVSDASASMQTMNAGMGNAVLQAQQMSGALQALFAAANSNAIQVSLVAPLQQAAPAIDDAKEKTALLTVENINAALSVVAFAGYFDPLEAVVGNLGIELGRNMDQLISYMGSIEATNGLLSDIENGVVAVTGTFWGMGEAVFSTAGSITKGISTLSDMHGAADKLKGITELLTDAKKKEEFITGLQTTATKLLNFAMAQSPIFIIIGAVMALCTVLYVAWQRSESFRRILFGVWEVAKTVFKGLFEIGKFVFDAYVTMWTSLGKLILGVFNAPFDGGKMLQEGQDGLAKSYDMLTSIPDKMNKLGEDVGKAWAQGQDKGSESFNKSQEEKKKGKQPANLSGNGSGQVINYANIAGTNTPSLSNNNASSVNSSKTVSIRIESLVKELNIYTNIKDGAQEMRNMIKEELIAAVRDFELSTSNG